MVINPIKLILLFFALFSISLEQLPKEDLKIDGTDFSGHFSNSKSFRIIRDYFYLNKEYININVKSSSDKNQIVLFSENDSECMEGRIFIGMKPFGPIDLFLKKSQLSNSYDYYSNEKSFYLCVKCMNGEACDYEISTKSDDSAIISIGDKYSYYITESNTEMKFKLKTNSHTSEILYNIWVKGENPDVSLENPSVKGTLFKYGKMYNIKQDGNTDSYSMTVRGKKGDFITIGSIEVNGNVAKELKLNDLEVMGVLTNDLREICFPFEKGKDNVNENDLVYINGLVFTKKIKTYYKENGNIVEFTEKKINDGIIIEAIYSEDYKSQKQYCVSFMKEDYSKDIVFSLQLSSNKHMKYNQLIYPPQLPGIIYPHLLQKNETAVFQGMKPTEGASEINYNMKSIMGFPDMLFEKCNTFPECYYNDSKLDVIIDPHHSNRMSVYSFYLKDEKPITPISSFQPLMIVKCKEGQTEKDKKSSFCIFETAIFTNKDRLHIKEAETFSQFLLKGEKDLYTIDFSTEENIEKVYLDLIVFSGDVRFKMDDSNSEQMAHKYFLSNKIFYSISTKYFTTKNIDFSVIAEKNSFYIIQFQYVKAGDESKITNIIESGTNFIESIAIGENKEDSKIIELQNFKIDVGTPFLASFYSKNCKFIVSLENDPHNITFLDMYGYFGQIIIDETHKFYYEDKYKFRIKVLDNDISEYNKKLCMIYVSGLELENVNTGSQRTISISEGVPHSFIFSQNYSTISYSFHLSDRTLPVVIDFNLIDKSIFNVKISFDYFPYKNITVYRNLQFFINSNDTINFCPIDEICTINIVIKLSETSKPRRVETTVSQINGAPVYLEKNTIKQDFLVGNNYKFYYLDIGNQEVGDITINYKRTSGNIYAKIVKKTELKEIENSDWRGIYKFPRSLNDSMVYDAYLKKIIIKQIDTEDCKDGCYVLITVKSSNVREDIDGKTQLIPYRITITPRIFSSNASVPKVNIQVNEYIIGNVYSSEDKIDYYYYGVFLPYESDLINIDWQADKPILLINVGYEKPTINNSDFSFPSTEHDTVLRISKQQILDVCKKRSVSLHDPDSIRYLNLTIGIYTKEVDSLYSSVYSFKIFQPPTLKAGISKEEREAFEIIHIRSDQKVQCDPGDFLVCLFAVIFDEGDISSNLIVFPKAQDENINVEFYANFIDAERIERNDIDFISKNIPVDGTAQFSSKGGKKYIYAQNVEKGKCLLLFVGATKPSIIEVLSSTSNNYQITPNPSTPQIFAIQNRTLYLNFDTIHDLLINIVCVSGEGYFFWEEEKKKNYNLMGFGDRLTLTSGTKNKSLSKLVAQSTYYDWLNEDKSGFVFYITYYPRNSEYNIDQVKAGRTMEFNYREVKFPLNFFTTVSEKDIAISFNFYNLYINNEVQNLNYIGPLFKIWGNIISQEEAFNARKNKLNKPQKNSNTIYGNCDGPFGSLFLNQTDIEKFGVDEKKNRSLFFSIEINKDYIDKNKKEFNFTGVSLEVSVLKEQNREEAELITPENVYLNGKLSNNDYFGMHYFRYKLRIDPKNPYMGIEFSANSAFVNWALSKEEFTPENSTDLEGWEATYMNGRTILTFKVPENSDLSNNFLYLIVFNIDKQTIEPSLANYVFKYMNAKDKEYFKKFVPKNTKVDLKKITDPNTYMTNYTLTFNIAHEYIQGEDIIYYIKGLYHDSLIVDENINSIAISESEGVYKQESNPLYDTEKKITLKLENVERELAHIKIMAKINANAINEYVLYDIVNSYEEKTSPEIAPRPESSEPIKIEYDSRAKLGQMKLDISNKKEYLQNFVLEFKNLEEIPKYIKIETLSEEMPNQVIYSYNNNMMGINNRDQLAQKGYGYNNVMWIKKEQLLQSNHLNFGVQCQNKGGQCRYTVQITGHNEALIEGSTLSYSYFVNNGNRVMEFKLKNEVGEEDTTDHFLTFYATGQKPITLDVKNCIQCNQYNFRAGAAITVDMIKKKYFEMTVTAQEGDFISVGSKYTLKEGKSPGNTLTPNDRPITGYLKKNVLNKECFLLPDSDKKNNIDTYYVSIMLYNRIAKITYAGSDYIPLQKYDNVNKGFYSYVYKPEISIEKYICIEFPSTESFNINDIPYSIQLTEPKNQTNVLNIYIPQISGRIYPRIIPKGSIVFFNALPPTSQSKEQIYNIMATEGLPQMFIHKCTTYPFCKLDINEIEKTPNIIKPNEINGLTTWINKDLLKYNPIQNEQYIMYVKCPDVKNETYEVCQFQTSILGNNDTVFLIEKQPFSQFILKGEPDKFYIDISNEIDIIKIHIDTLVISGDVSFTLINGKTGKEVVSHKYYLANKIFYTVTTYENTGMDIIIVEIKAKLNSYYVVEYKLVRSHFEQTLNDVYSGINYLIPIPVEKGVNEKLLNIDNYKLSLNNNYLISFNSLNCKIDLERIIYKDNSRVKIKSYGNYAQELLKNQKELKETTHSYQINVKEKDNSNYDNRMCMLYVSGLEITKENSLYHKELLVGEGVPQKAIFEDGLTKVRYVYPLTNKTKNIAVILNVITIAKFKMNIIYNYNNNETEVNTFTTSDYYFLKKDNINSYCKENEICTIIIEISVVSRINNQIPIIETSIRPTKEVPIYLPKGVVKKDYVSGNTWLYLFTDVGKDDSGYISINFERGSFEVFAKIVQKNQEKEDPEPEWRKYKFPKYVNKSLLYDFYNKKLYFTNEETENCDKGCYILISLRSTIKGSVVDEFRFYPFIISVGFTPSKNSQQIGQRIEIQPEEYVIGFLDKIDKIQSKEMYEYFEITIPYDADKVEFDWQSDAAILLVNVGNERPIYNKEKSHFIFDKSRSDTVFTITKEELKRKGNLDSIDKATLVLAAYTEVIDSIIGTVYSFKVHFSRSLNIYKVNSDQKNLCKPERVGNEYRCLYMITFNNIDYINDMMIYSRSQSKSAKVYMYGDFIENQIYDEFNIDELRNKIPNENSKYNTKREQIDFIFLTMASFKSHFYLKVFSDKDDIIELVTSFQTFDKELSPNPSTMQVFPIMHESYLKLKFNTQKGLLINIVSIFGEAKLYLEKEKDIIYHLRGRDDRLSLALPYSYDEAVLPVLVIENKDFKNDTEPRRLVEESSHKIIEKPVFAFYIEYYLRSTDLNLDEIYPGKTTEVAYKTADFPLYFYSKLDSLNTSINSFFSFHDLVLKNKTFANREISSFDFELKGNVIKQNSIYHISSDTKPEFKKAPIVGVYDPAIQTGQIFCTPDKLKVFNITEKEKPTLYLEFLNRKSNTINYEKIRLELSVVPENSDIPVTEKLYQFGKIIDINTVNSYKLKVDNFTGFMRIQFSTNSPSVGFAISEEKGSKTNTTFTNTETKFAKGKGFITFNKPQKEFIYLNVFLKDSNQRINNYAFKYINTDKKEKLFEYNTLGNDLSIKVKNEKVKGGKLKLTATFKKIDSNRKINVIYSLKVVLKRNNDIKELTNTIALSQSPSIVKQVENPKENEIKLTLENIDGDYRYAQVIAQINDGPITEYVAYNAYMHKSSRSGNAAIFAIVVISIILFIIVIILIIVIITFNAKNRDLLQKVNAVSFVDPNQKGINEGGNLLMDDNNELK